MARRNIDLGPRPSDPVGRIRRVASARRMAVQHVPVSNEDNEVLRVVDQPFRVVVTKQHHNNAVRWAVTIERGSKLDEGYTYHLPVRHRRKLDQALGIATTLAMALACSRFFIEFDEDVHHALTIPGSLDTLFEVDSTTGDVITCYLKAPLLQRTMDDNLVSDIFDVLMSVTDRTEIF